VVEMISAQESTLPEYPDLVDGKVYDIVYMGDRALKMFKYHHTLYIVDPSISNG
jgi:hypothetical protein